MSKLNYRILMMITFVVNIPTLLLLCIFEVLGEIGWNLEKLRRINLNNLALMPFKNQLLKHRQSQMRECKKRIKSKIFRRVK